jgi:sporulation protein YlmC with PRC-barrel domain
MKYSDLKNKRVVDAKGESIGKVIDFVFSYKKNIVDIKSILIGGSRVEEILEAIGAKPDIDPVFQVDCIDHIDEEAVHLHTTGESLKTTLDPATIEEDDMKLSKLAKLKVIDSDGLNVGNVIDVWFDESGELWLVLGGGFLEEALEKLRIQPDIDLLVPQDYIQDITQKEIHLKWTKFQLESNCEKEYEKLKKQSADRAEPRDARYTQIKLSGLPSRGVS